MGHTIGIVMLMNFLRQILVPGRPWKNTRSLCYFRPLVLPLLLPITRTTHSLAVRIRMVHSFSVIHEGFRD